MRRLVRRNSNNRHHDDADSFLPTVPRPARGGEVLGGLRHRRDAVRDADARDHVVHCGVLLPQPRQQGHQGAGPKGQPRGHRHQSTLGLQERPRHRRPRTDQPDRRDRHRTLNPHHVGVLPLRRRRLLTLDPARPAHRPRAHHPGDTQMAEQTAVDHGAAQGAEEPVLQGRDPLQRRHLPRRPRAARRPADLAAGPRPSRSKTCWPPTTTLRSTSDGTCTTCAAASTAATVAPG